MVSCTKLGWKLPHLSWYLVAHLFFLSICISPASGLKCTGDKTIFGKLSSRNKAGNGVLFSTYLSAVEDTGILTTIEDENELVFAFVPTDKAFRETQSLLGLEDEYRNMLEDTSLLRKVMSYQLISISNTTCSEKIRPGEYSTRLKGTTVTIQGNVVIAGARGAAAQILETIPASNGVIFVINAVLLPVSKSESEGELLMERSGITSCLDMSVSRGLITGGIVYPSDPEYEKARRSTSLLWSNWPVGIIQAANDKDIQEAFRCAKRYDVKVTARSGGHGNAGQSSLTGGLQVNLRSMNSVSISDDIGVVGSGATVGEVVYHLWELSNGTRSLPVGQKPTVGISGITLGGGFGFSSRIAGLLCDHLVDVKIVLPSGDIVRASAQQNQDLFWASCGGGGGNFGIVTEFRFKLMNVSEVYTQFLYYIPVRDEAAPTVVSFYQDWSLRFDPRATINMEMARIGDISSQHPVSHEAMFPQWIEDSLPDEDCIEIVGIFKGSKSELYASLQDSGLNDTTSIRINGFYTKSGSLLTGILDLSGWDTPNAESLLSMFENQHTYYKYKSFFLVEKLPEEAIKIILNSVFIDSDSVSQLIFEFQSLGNSTFSAVSPTATAFSHRNARHCLMFKSNAATLEAGSFALGQMEMLWKKILPFVSGAAYVNHLDTDIWDYKRSYYGIQGQNSFKNEARLRSISQKYNPVGRLSTVLPI